MKSQNLLIKYLDLPAEDVIKFHLICDTMSQIEAINNFLISSGKTMSFARDCPITPSVLFDLTSDIIDLINLKVKEHYEKVSQDSTDHLEGN